MTDADPLRAVADRQAIAGLLYRYCRAVDRMDHALGRSVWHADGTADYGADVYQGSGWGFIDRVCAMHAGLLHHSHQVTNIVIDLNGDQAGSEAYCFAALRYRRGEALVHMAVWSRYIDRWSRRGGRWGIDHRRVVIDFDETREVTAMRAGTDGRRDRDDPSYAVLRPDAP